MTRLALRVLAALLAVAWHPSTSAAQTAPPPRAAFASSLATFAPPQAVAGKNRTKGALWGAGIGAVAGGVLTGITYSSDDDDPGDFIEDATIGSAVLLGAALGAGIGALLGATVFAPDRPADAPATAFSVTPVPEPAGGMSWRVVFRRTH